jgi:hypothetical protein
VTRITKGQMREDRQEVEALKGGDEAGELVRALPTNGCLNGQDSVAKTILNQDDIQAYGRFPQESEYVRHHDGRAICQPVCLTPEATERRCESVCDLYARDRAEAHVDVWIRQR